MRIDLNTRRPLLANRTGGLSGPAIERINSSNIAELALLNTIPPIESGLSEKIKYLSVGPMFSEAIERIYQETSISKLFR